MKNRITLNETTLRRMIMEAINEIDWKTYANAANRVKTHFSDKDVDDVADRMFTELGYSLDDKWKIDNGDTYRECWRKAQREINQKSYDSYQRKFRFQQAAEDRFKEDYGHEDETGEVGLTTGRWDDGGTSWDAYIKDNQGNSYGYARYFVTNQDFYGQNGQHEPGKWCVGTVGWAGAVAASPDFDTREEAQRYADEHDMSTKVTKPSTELAKAYSRSREETRKYDPYDGTSGSRNNPRYQYLKGKGWVYPSDEEINESVRKVLKKYLNK